MRHLDTFEFIVVGFFFSTSCYLVALTHETGIFKDWFLNISMINTKHTQKKKYFHLVVEKKDENNVDFFFNLNTHSHLI